MKNNPFTSQIFNSVWLKHFYNSKPSFSFDFIKNVTFFKKSNLPLYVNVGKNLTKGIYYQLEANQDDFKGKVFLIYDVPDYFNVNEDTSKTSNRLGLKKVFQYNGYLMNYSDFKTPDEYIKNQFSKNNKRYVRWSHIKRLEECFDISYEFIYGDVTDEKYEFIFNHFYRLLNIRFDDKNIDYHHLKDTKWMFYKDVILPLIRTKQASFLVIYNEGIPVGVNLNYHSENTLFKAITVFDVDYYKFSIGKLSVLKLMDWCFENNYKYSDFSKGYFDYKEIWSNTCYGFNYHILYDKKSIAAVIIANAIEKMYKLKLYLREKNYNHKYRKLIYKLKRKKETTEPIDTFEIKEINDFIKTENYSSIDIKDKNHHHLLKHVYSFLFTNPEPIGNLNFYKDKNNKSYVIKGSAKAISINNKTS
jgi:hypothetical protein